MIPSALHLFHPNFYEPLNLATQLERLPPVDAQCGHGFDPCRAPFCTCMTWEPTRQEDE